MLQGPKPLRIICTALKGRCTITIAQMRNKELPYNKMQKITQTLQNGNPADIEIMALISILFYGFFRISEGRGIHKNDITIEPATITLKIVYNYIPHSFGCQDI